MKKLFLILAIAIVVTGFLYAADKVIIHQEIPINDLDPNASSHTVPQTDDLFDLQFEWPVGVGGGEAGIETDGNYIYTSKWNGTVFYRYAMDGTYIEEFSVTGCPGAIRDLAYDGQYFYGAAATNTVYEMDFDTQTVISTITAPIAVRAIAYDEVNDGFWGNNWSDTITLFDRSGAPLDSFPCGTFLSYYGFAWENILPGGPYLWGYSQDGPSLNQLVQYDIATGLETGVNFDIGSITTVGTGIAGGVCISDAFVPGTWTICGTAQNTIIWGVELATAGYCDASTSVQDEYIANVLCAEINNSSGWQGGVADYTALSATIAVGGSEDMLVTNGNAWSSDAVTCWVDWNDDYTFELGGDEEFVLTNNGTGEFFTGAISVPMGTSEDMHRMRIRMVYSAIPDPCGNSSYGEIEDYTINVTGGSVVYPLPFAEGFEGGVLPDDWTQEYVVNTLDWVFQTGGYSGNPATAHGGTYNALLYESGYNGTTTKLITPQIDMGTATDVTLTFWHAQTNWIGDQDNLRVYYKNSAGGAWTMLAEYLGDIPVWTEEIITLPDLSGDYYIAFEGWLDYGYGVCLDDISIEGTATTLDPPANVSVDGNSGIVTWDPPPTVIVEDNFDSYTVGDYLCVVAPDLWATWSGTPGGSEDVFISDAQASSPDNSIIVELNQDIVLLMDDYTTGRYSYEMKMYVPSGYCGYFNLQKTSTPGTEWAFQIYYQTSGIALADAGGAGALTHPFNHDEWMDLKVIVDLDSDWATYYFNGVEMIGYQWTLGTFGTPGLLQFGGVNIFGGANAGTTDTPMFYVDDVVLTETYEVPARDHIGYNVYLDAVLQATVGTDVFEYPYTGLTPDQTYTAGVSALYDEGESEIIEDEFTYTPVTTFDPPNNLVASVVNYNEVELVWEAPGGTGGEFLHHTGYDNNGIGTGGVADFICAARFDDVELGDFYGCSITQVKVHIRTADFDYVHIKVWEGGSIGNPGTEVYDADITGDVLIEDWTVHTLTTPVLLVAGNEYWIGYDIHATFDHPCSVDAGPMVPDKGAWIYFSGAWDTLANMGLDYNWCIEGVAAPTDGFATKAPVNKERVTISAMRPMLISDAPLKARFTRGRRTKTSYTTRETRYLSGYKVYRDAAEIAEITDPLVLTYTDDEGLDAGVYDYYVTAVYSDPAGESDPSNTESAEIILPIPQGVNATFNYPNVLVSWDPLSESRDLLSYSVYRDGVEVATGITSTMYIDPGLPSGTYVYTVTAVFTGGWESDQSDGDEVIVTGTDNILIPVRTELTGNYPNPFNPTTMIKFALKEAGNVNIKIYNIKGAVVRTLVDGEMDAAYHELIWDGKDNTGKQVGSGVYFYKMKAEKYTATKKMILMK